MCVGCRKMADVLMGPSFYLAHGPPGTYHFTYHQGDGQSWDACGTLDIIQYVFLLLLFTAGSNNIDEGY